MTVPFLDLGAGLAELRPAIDAAYARVMASGRWILGPEVEAFEAAFAAYCGVAHVVGVGSGLDALVIALEVAGIGPGDEVIVPAHTFIATWLAVTAVGAAPVPAEPAPGGFHVDAETIAACLGPRTRAILPVHLYGDAVDMTPLLGLAAQHGLVVIEDAAQAHGARYRGRALGGLGRLGAFSFYPGKNLGAFGDAGALVTDDEQLCQAARRRRNYGSLSRCQHDMIGRNSRLDPLQAAFLGAKLPRLDAWNGRRRAIAARYDEAFAGLDTVVPPPRAAHSEPVWHLYVVRCRQRDALQAHLAALGIETLVHYPRPVYRYPPYEGSGPARGSPADRLTAAILSLPIGPHLTDDQVARVIDGVSSFRPWGAPAYRADSSSSARARAATSRR